MARVSIPLVQDLGGVYLLDTRQMGVEGIIGVFLIPGPGNSFILVETGAGSTLPTIKRGIAEAGFELQGLSAILLTHIHLDHAGAAGALAQETGAKVYVHARGAPHLNDPSRLLASATRIYGDRMDALWGTIVPIPAAQLEVLSGGETLDILGHRFEALYTPGHASHHLTFLLNGGALFTGDAAGVYLTGSSVLRPALPPPEIDLETWRESVATMLAAAPKRLLLTHFGEVKNAQAHLRAVPERNQTWADVILEGLQRGDNTDALVKRISDFGNAELRADGAPPEVVKRHQTTSNYTMTAAGVERYWRKFHPNKVEGS